MDFNDEMRRLLERQQEIERMLAPLSMTGSFDAQRTYGLYGIGELADTLNRMLEGRREIDALIDPIIRDFVLPQTELERAIGKLLEPGAGLNAFSALQNLVNTKLPQQLITLSRAEWDSAREILERSDWKSFAESLAMSSASVDQIWGDAIQFAEEHATAKVEKLPHKRKRERLALADWLAIVGLLFAILQGVRSELLAVQAEESAAKSEAAITATIQSSVFLILKEMQRQSEERRSRRWEARDGPVQLVVSPSSRARRIAELPLGIVATQIGRSEDWIQLTAETEKGRITGWTRRRKLDLVQ